MNRSRFILSCILLFLLSGTGFSQEIASTKKTVGILIFKNAEVLDFAGPFEVFSVASQIHNDELFDVKVIAKTREPVHAVNGLSVNPDHSFEDAPMLDVLIISGGMGASLLLNDETTLNWVKNTVENAELTMSVCTGAAVLAKLEMLDGLPYCTHHTVYPFVEKLAPTALPQKEKRFTQSAERLYTSAGISAGIDLSFHIVEKFWGREVARNTATYMEYKGYE